MKNFGEACQLYFDYPENEGIKFLQITGWPQPIHLVSYPRSMEPTLLSLQKFLILGKHIYGMAAT